MHLRGFNQGSHMRLVMREASHIHSAWLKIATAFCSIYRWMLHAIEYINNLRNMQNQSVSGGLPNLTSTLQRLLRQKSDYVTIDKVNEIIHQNSLTSMQLPVPFGVLRLWTLQRAVLPTKEPSSLLYMAEKWIETNHFHRSNMVRPATMSFVYIPLPPLSAWRLNVEEFTFDVSYPLCPFLKKHVGTKIRKY